MTPSDHFVCSGLHSRLSVGPSGVEGEGVKESDRFVSAFPDLLRDV